VSGWICCDSSEGVHQVVAVEAGDSCSRANLSIVSKLSARMSGWKDKWVNVCNKIGTQTTLTVVNRSPYTLLVKLEVGGVVYKTEMLPANSGDEEWGYDPLGEKPSTGEEGNFEGSNFAVVKFPCGFAWYTVSACTCAQSDFTGELIENDPPRRLHFVYGGSRVIIRPDSESKSKVKLFNESATYDADGLSEKWENSLEATKTGMVGFHENHLKPAVEKVKEKVNNMRAEEPKGEYGSGAATFKPQTSGPGQLLSEDDYSRTGPSLFPQESSGGVWGEYTPQPVATNKPRAPSL